MQTFLQVLLALIPVIIYALAIYFVIKLIRNVLGNTKKIEQLETRIKSLEGKVKK